MLEECLEWDRNVFSVVCGVDQPDIEELESSYVDEVGVEVCMIGLAARIARKPMVSRVLAYIFEPIHDLREAFRAKISALYSVC